MNNAFQDMNKMFKVTFLTSMTALPSVAKCIQLTSIILVQMISIFILFQTNTSIFKFNNVYITGSRWIGYAYKL